MCQVPISFLKEYCIEGLSDLKVPTRSCFAWEECLTPIFASEESYVSISKVIGAYLVPCTAGVLTQDIPAESTPSSPAQSTGS